MHAKFFMDNSLPMSHNDYGDDPLTTQPSGDFSMFDVDAMRQARDRGFQKLDQTKPDWRNSINLDELDMACTCILFQVYGDYEKGMQALGLRWGRSSDPDKRSQSDSAHYGFNLGNDELNGIYSDLTHLWKDRLQKETITP